MQKLVNNYIELLKSGLTYDEINNMIELDNQISLKKQYLAFDDKTNEFDINYINNIKTVIKDEDDYYLHRLALYNAYNILYRPEIDYMRNEKKKSL